MPTAADLSVHNAEVVDLPVDQSPYIDSTIDPADAEAAQPDVVDESNAVPISIPLMSLAARGAGMTGDSSVKRQLGFFREAGRVARTLAGQEAVGYSPLKVGADNSAHETLIRILDDEQCNPVALAAQLDVVTSKEWRDWLPEVLADFTSTAESDVRGRDKLLACQVAVTNSDVGSNWTLFCACSSAFNHRRANFQSLDVPTYLEAANTCFTLRQLRPGIEFQDGVIKFIAALMMDQGLCFFPWIGGPGLALGINDDGISAGLTDVKDLSAKVKALWESGELHGLEPGEHDESDPLHVQLAKLVGAETYIKAQHSINPADYQPENENAATIT